jgi:hypothetical protein
MFVTPARWKRAVPGNAIRIRNEEEVLKPEFCVASNWQPQSKLSNRRRETQLFNSVLSVEDQGYLVRIGLEVASEALLLAPCLLKGYPNE